MDNIGEQTIDMLLPVHPIKQFPSTLGLKKHTTAKRFHCNILKQRNISMETYTRNRHKFTKIMKPKY